ncbi:hypothetical protein ACG5V6_03700 [Streptomyces chitinivorans]|uniref:Uncharacterized protein n=1 Tax=Streptomyces chitinivorans TaxID=1257027 RepID=A0ABW7HNG5_9ACTN|nr:hypothetical protein [Streptomyces chitinivorans]MDH2411124.1 hypothetical protein [Streptomyces chitinivorans]
MRSRANDFPRLAVRQALSALCALGLAWGTVVTVELIDRTLYGNCGPRWNVPCEQGRGELTWGVAALLLAFLLHGRITRVRAWSGPDLHTLIAFGLFPAGAALVFADHTLNAGHTWPWRIAAGVLAVVCLALACLTAGGVFVKPRTFFHVHFWCLEQNWVEGDREERFVTPSSPRERFHCAVFLTGALAGAALGVSLGILHVVRVAGGFALFA